MIVFLYKFQQMHADKTKITKAYAQIEPPMPAEFTPDQRACLQSLHFAEMHWRRNDIAHPAPATCAWLLDHTKYHDWLDRGHGLLWIKGNPGSGKSTVLKHVLETAEQEPKQNFILASFFFHGRGAPIQRNVLGLFRSLLHQILQQNRVLLSDFTSLYKRRSETEGHYGSKWTWNENELQSFFKSNIVHTAKTHQTRVYIDALDECGQDIALDLVEFFRCFAAPISICYSCRHYPFVTLEGGNEVCVQEENKQDIDIYVQNKLEAHVQSTDVAGAIRDEIVSRSQGNFQWVVLVVPRVLKLYKSRKPMVTIQTMVRSIPAELSELYTDILDGIEEHERARSLHFMQWICFAFRPLTLMELRFALVVNADTSYTSIHQCQGSEFYVETDEDMKIRVYDLSKGLAEVLENSGTPIVQFIHQSAKDFLIEKGLQILNKSFAGAVAGSGHFWISRSCIQIFHLEEVQNLALSLGHSHMNIDILDKGKKRGEYALLNYSTQFWPLHAVEVEGANIPQDDLAAPTFETPDGICQSWFAIYQILNRVFYFFSGDSTLLHVASRHNLISVVKAVLTHNVWADRPNEYSQTPLSIAAITGHEVVVKLLLDRDDVDMNQKGTNGDTPLTLAAKRGHKAIAEMLINRDDTDLNSKNLYGGTALSEAARHGHNAVVRILLERGVNSNWGTNGQVTPLALAAMEGHESTMKLLLQHNADINASDTDGVSPLSYAASKGQYGVVQFLLQHNADIDAKDRQEKTPLSLAAYSGHYDVVELLLQYNADIEARDDTSQTPLSLAAGKGRSRVVELLLQHNADIDARDSSDETPLSHAVRHTTVVKLLLQRTSNVNSINKYGQTPLSLACRIACNEVVELLLGRSDVDINLKDKNGRSPLSWARRYIPTSTQLRNKHLDLIDLISSRHDISIKETDQAGWLRLLREEGKLKRERASYNMQATLSSRGRVSRSRRLRGFSRVR